MHASNDVVGWVDDIEDAVVLPSAESGSPLKAVQVRLCSSMDFAHVIHHAKSQG